MTLDPLFAAPPVVQFHVAVAMISLLIGPIAIFPRRRKRLHKTVGYFWVLAMVATALSSFFIHSFDVLWGLSPIHFFEFLMLYAVTMGIWHITQGNVAAHRNHMVGLYGQGLLIAGLANFLPGRTTNRVFFESSPELGYVMIALGGICIVTWMSRGGVRRTPVAA